MWLGYLDLSKFGQYYDSIVGWQWLTAIVNGDDIVDGDCIVMWQTIVTALIFWGGVARIGPIRSVVSVNLSFLIRIMNTEQNNKRPREKTKPKQFRVEQNTDTENKHPQLKSETRLPKYDSQSGTTITAASDWEPYQAEHSNPKSIEKGT